LVDSLYLMVATPCFGGQLTVAYVNSVLALQRACLARGIKINFNMRIGEALITRARADMVAEFLRTDATHLLFIDADIGFAPEQVFRLLAFDADMTAAAYPFKRIDWEKARQAVQRGRTDVEAAILDYVFYPDGTGPMEARNDFVRVRYTGTGFLMMRRSALTRMCEAHPELRYKAAQREADLVKDGPYNHALFECMIDPENGLYLSEDYAFCQRWRELGGAIWLDIRSKLTHYGTHAFKGDLEKQFSSAKPAAQQGNREADG
jgi:hypothetical protein